MTYDARVIRVMIASPSDVAKERQIIRDVIHEWNAVNAEDRGLVLMPVGWETNATPEIGDRPQAIINRQLLKGCDLLVAVFWTRLGSPTGAEASGTVEEIEEHVAARKPAMIYFSDVPVRLDSSNDAEYGRLRQFKADLGSRGLFEEYEDLTAFRTLFARQLAQRVIASFTAGEPAEEYEEDDARRSSAPAISDEARELLQEAVRDSHGLLIRLETLDSSHIETNGRDFVEPGSVRSAARWRAAVSELQHLGLVEDRVGKGEVFYITDAGYRVAEFYGAE
jgi:hypothetical protein